MPNTEEVLLELGEIIAEQLQDQGVNMWEVDWGTLVVTEDDADPNLFHFDFEYLPKLDINQRDTNGGTAK